MTKTLRMILPLAALFALALASCSEGDDKKEEKKNFLKIGDNETELVGGVLEDYGGEAGIYYIDLHLFGKGLGVADGEITGKGNGIYFEIYTSAADGPVAGT